MVASCKKKKKTKGIKQLKADLWRLFTFYIKKKYSHDGEWCSCYTCGRPIRICDSQCCGGHYLNKTAHPVHYFHEDNVRPQCMTPCNGFKEGNSAVFRDRLIEEIGVDKVIELEETKYQEVKRSRDWYLEKINEFKGKLDEL